MDNSGSDSGLEDIETLDPITKDILPDDKNSPPIAEKAEKNRHTGETSESSSLSSESGSWESVFPPKSTEKDKTTKSTEKNDIAQEPGQKGEKYKNKSKAKKQSNIKRKPGKGTFPGPSEYSRHRSFLDFSPVEWSDHSDSLEQDSTHTDKKEEASNTTGEKPKKKESLPFEHIILQRAPGIRRYPTGPPPLASELPRFTIPIASVRGQRKKPVDELLLAGPSQPQPGVQKRGFLDMIIDPYGYELRCKLNEDAEDSDDGDSNDLPQSVFTASDLDKFYSLKNNPEESLPSWPFYRSLLSPVPWRPRYFPYKPDGTFGPMTNVPLSQVPSFPAFLVRPTRPPHWLDNYPDNPNRGGNGQNNSAGNVAANNANPSNITPRVNIDPTPPKEPNAEVAADDEQKNRASLGSEKTSEKFYIDLSSLPDKLPEKATEDKQTDKKNMFSMFIDFNEKTTTKKDLVKKEVPQSSSSTNDACAQAQAVVSESNNPQLSKPNTKDSMCTFEKLELLCNDPNISISDIIQNDPEPNSVTSDKPGVGPSSVDYSTPAEATCKPSEDEPNQPAESFVKLSDLDKPAKSDEKIKDARMTRSIPEVNYRDSSSPRPMDIMSSFHSENALSLNRLFPHLKAEFSSAKASTATHRSQSPVRMDASPGDADDQASELSDTGSELDGSTEDNSQASSSTVDNCQSKLGQDLLRMFLEEIAPDVIVEVAGRRIKAHKCILSSRCQYFAGILSGGWVESAGNVISIPKFSFNVVHFALCHIYSGMCTIPETIGIAELTTLADMLGLEGLKEAIMSTLKSKYCHHFHWPCPVCMAGVLESFYLCALYGLEDLCRKCLDWICKHFSILWPKKAFATLPPDLLDKCYQHVVTNLTPENVIDTVCGCGIAMGRLQPVRWAEPVNRMCRRLINAAAHFSSTRLLSALRFIETLPDDLPQSARTALDEYFVAVIERAPPEEACSAYDYLSEVVRDIDAQNYSSPDVVIDGEPHRVPEPQNMLSIQAVALCRQVENALVHAAPRVVTTQAFRELPVELRKRLRELGCIMFGPQAIANSPQHHRCTETGPTTSTSTSTRSNSFSRPIISTKFGNGPKPSHSIKPNLSTKPSASAKASPSNKSSNSTKPNTSAKASTSAKPRSNTKQSDDTKPSAPTSGLRSEDIDHVRASFVPYVPKPVAHRSLDPMSVNNDPSNSNAPVPKIRTTKAQEERAKFNKSKSNSMQGRVNNSSQRLNAFENTMPRYLEPRSLRDEKKRASRKLGPKLVSSSDSSRNSSPVLARSLGATRSQDWDAMVQALAQESFSFSRRPYTAEPPAAARKKPQPPSASNNKYATYTKAKHAKDSVETPSVKSQSHSAPPMTNKIKTKIPVSTNQKTTPVCAERNPNKCQKMSAHSIPGGSGLPRTPTRVKPERKLPGSLMNATKSSSAKMQPKIVKDFPKKKTEEHKSSASSSKPVDSTSSDIPVMERSGTFLKDQPTFGDKTADIDQ